MSNHEVSAGSISNGYITPLSLEQGDVTIDTLGRRPSGDTDVYGTFYEKLPPPAGARQHSETVNYYAMPTVLNVGQAALGTLE